MTKILDGIKIIDFTQGHTGSYGTMLLADFGAEVCLLYTSFVNGDSHFVRCCSYLLERVDDTSISLFIVSGS